MVNRMSSTSDLSLPTFVNDHQHAFFEVPIKIVVIIVVTLVVRAVINRIITKAVEPSHGNRAPRILQPFRERVQNSAFFESTGLLSERRAQRAKTIGSVLKSFVTLVMFVIAIMLILSELGIDLAPFIAGTSIVGVALGFGAQSIVKDFLNGMFMMLEDQYGVGDVIDFELASGTVEAVGLRSTRLRDINGTVWYVRNGEVLRVGNKSQGFATVVLDLPIDAWADVEVASKAMLRIATEMRDEDEWKHVFMREPELLGVESLSRYETVIRLSARVRPLEQWRTARELRRRIRLKMDELDIGHPAPDGASEMHVSQIDPDSGPPVPSPDGVPSGSTSVTT